ncbi:hypothetical protein Glove_144g20 [Diversispora epigaea]|uniref:Uncharacterized protein n=1 Tax=Diversispora epigaea TaxID=1348612 RepID=A0A397IYT3_9GLOM|nr:hypothetical protein Glove_144g20 [Diversispora epigaea]
MGSKKVLIISLTLFFVVCLIYQYLMSNLEIFSEKGELFFNAIPHSFSCKGFMNPFSFPFLFSSLSILQVFKTDRFGGVYPISRYRLVSEKHDMRSSIDFINSDQWYDDSYFMLDSIVM